MPSSQPASRHAHLRTGPVAAWHVAGALLLAVAPLAAAAQDAAAAGSAPPLPRPHLRLSTTLSPTWPPQVDEAQLPLFLDAAAVDGRVDEVMTARGQVRLVRGTTIVRTDQLRYDARDERATATGNVWIHRNGDLFEGPELSLKLDTFEGFFLTPRYRLLATGGGGSAQRVDFLDRHRSVATQATYSTCTPDDTGDYDWLLSASSVRFDVQANEGVAENAVLRFKGLPILALPRMSFPLSDARKTGFLPPSIGLDNRSGFQYAQPYYWNLAPNRDATLTATAYTRRGLDLAGEYRYLMPSYDGEARASVLPSDRLTGTTRWSYGLLHEHRLGEVSGGQARLRVDLDRVSDDAYWKDFPRRVAPAVSPRLLASQGLLEWHSGGWHALARVHRWQTLQDPQSTIVPPYDRLPQLSATYASSTRQGLDWSVWLDATHFRNPFTGTLNSALLRDGTRGLAVAQAAWPLTRPWGFIVPRVQLHASQYRIEAPHQGPSRSESRFVPTASLDAGLVFERTSRWFGRDYLQTLEPRLFYVRTPYRDQSDLPLFDTAESQFNFASIFRENAFVGQDRISDANQLSVGLVTRLFDPGNGAQVLQLGAVQRLRFSPQRVTLRAGAPALAEELSDVLLGASGSVTSRLRFDGTVQYSPDIRRSVRSTLAAHYAPGPYRNLSVAYRFSRDLNEQIDIGWQWPVFGARAGGRRGSDRCAGTWYSVGRVNYSTRESRVTDSLFGIEYESGCWIGRVVVERLSTSPVQSTTRLLFQLELSGLSRLGSSPLQTLRDNIPGYRVVGGDSAPRPNRFVHHD